MQFKTSTPNISGTEIEDRLPFNTFIYHSSISLGSNLSFLHPHSGHLNPLPKNLSSRPCAMNKVKPQSKHPITLLSGLSFTIAFSGSSRLPSSLILLPWSSYFCD